LGSTIAPFTAVASVSSGNGFWTLSIPTAGYYFISFLANFSSTGSIVIYATSTLSGTNVPASSTTFVGGPTNGSGSFAIAGSTVVNCTASAYNLTVSWEGGSFPATFLTTSSYFQAVRIA
jgi:hypothetical protein